MSENPLFSIIVPTYNREDYIINTLQSVFDQNYSNYELIVVDDGSTDKTEFIINSRFGESLQYFKIQNSERATARNFGASKAKGDYLYFLDSDDILYPDHLALAAYFIDKNKGLEWFFQYYEFLKDGKQMKPSFPVNDPVKALVKDGNFMSCHGVFIRRDIFCENRFNDDRQLAGSEDYELWLRLAARYQLLINPTTSSALVEHEYRSVFGFAPEALINRKMKMIEYAFADPAVKQKFGAYKKRMEANAFRYISLHLMLSRKKALSIKFLIKALMRNPSNFLNKTTFAVLKRALQ